ncbi:hypothetical protein [Solirubrobacter soli]|uniref:hypothetical protein n=1 Tax=Solirubrobacter soli TaxID=363832 RepID=UPI000408E690|nr:hypothetical protein [Solirubrobacter soli]
MRRALLFLVVLLSAAPAQAAPRPLARNPTAAALAGDTVLYTQVTGRRLRVLAQPYTGGTPTEVFRRTAPRGRIVSAQLAASPQQAALLMTTDDGSAFGATDLFAGPPTGPWTRLFPSAEGMLPFRNQVVGEAVFTSELRGEFDVGAVVVRDPAPHVVEHIPPEIAYSAVFAGRFVAFTDDLRIVVQDWRTGEPFSTVVVPDPVDEIALRDDGRMVYRTDQHELYEGQRKLAQADGNVAFAGDRLVYQRGFDLRVLEPDGRNRRFGVHTEELDGFTTDGTRVLWWANGCLLTADVAELAVDAIAPGACPRSEVKLGENTDLPLRRTVSVPVRCVAAPRECRGTMRVRDGARVAARARFAVPSGHSRRVRITLSARTYAHARRKGSAHLPVELRTDDGDRSPASFTQALFLQE